MQNRFTTFKRGSVFYCEDLATRRQTSLKTRDEAEARRIVQAKNDAVKLPQMNLVMAKTYLSAQDPKMITRTWADGRHPAALGTGGFGPQFKGGA